MWYLPSAMYHVCYPLSAVLCAVVCAALLIVYTKGFGPSPAPLPCLGCGATLANARWAGAPGAWLARARRPLPPLAPLTRRKVVPSLAYARRDPATHSGGIPYIWGGGIYGGIYEGSWRGSSWAIECIVNARARAKWGGREGPNRGTLAYSTI